MSEAELIAIGIFLLVVMTGLGTTLSIDDFVLVLKKPKPMLVGFLGQFLIMPTIAFIVAIALNLPELVALSTVLLGASPGGVNSNLFTYYARGNVSLSISMTVCSSFICLLTIPAILGIASSIFTFQDIEVPIKKVFQSLVMVVGPVLLGLFIRAKNERLAKGIEMTASKMGVVMLFGILASTFYRNREAIEAAHWTVFAAGVCVSGLGFFLGYLGSGVLGLSLHNVRTISFETGLQNVSLTIGIIAFSFPSEQQTELLLVPGAYMLFVLPLAGALCLWFRKTSEKAGV